MTTARHSAYISAAADTSATRTETFEGRSYLVVPVTILIADTVVKPMGSTVAGLVSPDLVDFYPASWDGRPLLPNHPVASDGITPVSANSPAILDAEGFGQLFNTGTANGKLRSEAWIDVARAQALGGYAANVVARVQAGQTIEVSIGAYVITDPTPGTTASGESYGETWLLAFPDHLAMLPSSKVGACSIEMGCGGPRAASQHQSSGSGGAFVAMSIMSKARKPTYSGTESTAWSSPSFADYVKGLYSGDNPPATVADADSNLKSDIALTSLLGNPDATSFRELSFFPVVDPRNGKLNEKALRAVLSGRGSQANILSAAKKSAQDMARKLLKSEFNIDTQDSSSTSSASSKTAVSGLSDGDIRDLISDALYAVEPQAYYLYVDSYYEDDHTVIYCVSSEYESYGEYYQRTYEIDESGDAPMARVGSTRTAMVRKTTYEAAPVTPAPSPIITGASSRADPVDDPKSLFSRFLSSIGIGNSGTPATQQVTAESDPVSSSDTPPTCACGGHQQMATATPNVNPKDSPKAAAIQALISGPSPFKAEHLAQLEAMSEDVVTDLATRYAAPAETPASEVKTEPAPAVEQPAPTPVTMQQWLADNHAPAELHSLVSAHVAAEARERAYLTQSVIKACAGRSGAYTEAQLNTKDMVDLRALSASMGIGGPTVTDYSNRGIPVNASAFADTKPAEVPNGYKVALEKRAAKGGA